MAGEWEGGMLGAGNEENPKVTKVTGGSSLSDRPLEAMQGCFNPAEMWALSLSFSEVEMGR